MDMRDKLTAMLYRMPEGNKCQMAALHVMVRRCSDAMLGRVFVHVMREVLRQSRFLLRLNKS